MSRQHSKRQPQLVGRVMFECCGLRLTLTERDASESPPACPQCLESMLPVRAQLVRHTGRRR